MRAFGFFFGRCYCLRHFWLMIVINDNAWSIGYYRKNQRKGQLFLKDFKAVLIRTDEQLIHTSRYIHLNPYSGGVVNNLDELVKYDKSSFPNYLGLKNDKLVSSERIMSSFKNIDEYKNFVFDQAEYQREMALKGYIEPRRFDMVSLCKF